MRIEEATATAVAKEDTQDLYDLRSRALQLWRKYYHGNDDVRAADGPSRDQLLASYDLVWRELGSRGEQTIVTSLEKATLGVRLQKKTLDAPPNTRVYVAKSGKRRLINVVKQLENPPQVQGVLAFRAQIDDSPLGDKAWDWVKRDYLNGMSWSGFPTVVQDFRLPDAWFSIVLEINMSEISAVTLPGDENVLLEIEDEEKRIIKGTITSEDMNYLRQFIMPEAFEPSIERYMNKPPNGTMFINHDRGWPVGKFLKLWVEKQPVELDMADAIPDGPGTLGQRLERASGSGIRFELLKTDEERHEIGGVVYAPLGATVGRDSQGDWATPDDIHGAMRDFMVRSQTLDVMHDRRDHDALHVIECFQPDVDTPKGTGVIPAGAMYVTVWVDVEKEPEVWERAKSAALSGFSLDGSAVE